MDAEGKRIDETHRNIKKRLNIYKFDKQEIFHKYTSFLLIDEHLHSQYNFEQSYRRKQIRKRVLLMKNANYFNFIAPDNNFLDLKLYQYGREKCLPLHSFGPTIRNHFLFHYVISGCGTLFFRGLDGKENRYDIGANQGFLLCPDQITTYVADEHQPWNYVWLEFDGLRAEESLLKAGLEWNQPIYRPKRPEQGEELRDRMLYITDHHTASDLQLLGNLYLFLDQLISSSVTQQEYEEKKVQDFYVQEAIGYIQEHYRRNLTVEEVANFCKVNRDRFTRRFKRVVGCTPQEFLIRLRLTTAANLLKTTDSPIKDIAAYCGYPNPLHFSQAFKNFYGISPRAWRKEKELEKP